MSRLPIVLAIVGYQVLQIAAFARCHRVTTPSLAEAGAARNPTSRWDSSSCWRWPARLFTTRRRASSTKPPPVIDSASDAAFRRALRVSGALAELWRADGRAPALDGLRS